MHTHPVHFNSECQSSHRHLIWSQIKMTITIISTNTDKDNLREKAKDKTLNRRFPPTVQQCQAQVCHFLSTTRRPGSIGEHPRDADSGGGAVNAFGGGDGDGENSLVVMLMVVEMMMRQWYKIKKDENIDDLSFGHTGESGEVQGGRGSLPCDEDNDDDDEMMQWCKTHQWERESARGGRAVRHVMVTMMRTIRVW